MSKRYENLLNKLVLTYMIECGLMLLTFSLHFMSNEQIVKLVKVECTVISIFNVDI